MGKLNQKDYYKIVYDSKSKMLGLYNNKVKLLDMTLFNALEILKILKMSLEEIIKHKEKFNPKFINRQGEELKTDWVFKQLN